jgi:hypothetical protein
VTTLSSDDVKVEQRLLKTIIQFLLQSKEHQQFMVKERLPDASQFSGWLLNNLTKCIASTVLAFEGNDEQAILKDSLLTSKHRSEVFSMIISVSDAVSPMSDSSSKKSWSSAKNNFVNLLK